MITLPKISIVIVTFNNARTIETTVRYILSQSYPKHLIEYLNVDGGSTDDTLSILKKYGFTSLKSPIKKNAEAQRAIALREAKNNLIVSIDADNYLLDTDWIERMVQPFIDDPSVVHANTLHYAYKKDTTIFNRYCALFGVLDPIVYYIGRPDRLPQNRSKWRLGKKIKEEKMYFIVEHTIDTLPTVGCNGVVYKRDVLLKYAKSDPSHFLHIDVFSDLIEKGYNRFAVVKNDIFHDTAVDILSLLKKRIAFLSSYLLQGKIERRYLIYNPKKITDTVKLLLFIFYTVTFVKPLYDSIQGYKRVRDVAWFMHPLICWIFFYSYGVATLKRITTK